MLNKSNRKYYINDYSTKKDIIDSTNSSIIKYKNPDATFNTVQLVSDFKEYLDDFVMTPDQVLGITGLTEFISGNDSIFGLFGYAGTGKTSIIIHYIYYLLNNDYIKSIAISAPTNIAVDILKSKFLDLYELDLCDISTTMTNTIDDIINIYEKKGKKITFATVHKILGIKSTIDVDGKQKFDGPRNNINFKRYNLIIIDECSMLSSDVVGKILEDVKKFSSNFNVKIIFLGDPAQLPPVNLAPGMNDSIVFNKKIPKGVSLYDEKVKLLSFKSVTMTNIVRTNDPTIINLCNELRKWISNEIARPALKNFRGNKIKYYNYANGDKVNTKWFSKFLEYKQDTNKRNIILTWTNQQTNSYNIAARMALKKEKLEEYEENDCLIMNTFYNLQPIDQLNLGLDSEYIIPEIVYTSEQVIASQVWKTKLKIGMFQYKEITQKLGDDVIKKYKNTIDELNKKSIKVVNVWKLCILRHKKDIPSGYMFICRKENQSSLNIKKEEIEQIIRKLSDYYDNTFLESFDNIAECIIKPLWLEYNKLYIHPFGNVSYGNSITSHKAQGSNFNNVFVDAHDILMNGNIPESRKCLYTAITRVSDEVHMLL